MGIGRGVGSWVAPEYCTELANVEAGLGGAMNAGRRRDATCERIRLWPDEEEDDVTLVELEEAEGDMGQDLVDLATC